MGLFGIKTKKEKAAEAAAAKAKQEARDKEMIEGIRYWDYDMCAKAIKDAEAGTRTYSRKVLEAIKNRKYEAARENAEWRERRELDKKIEAQEKEVSRLKGRSPWQVTGGAGGYFAVRSTDNDKRMQEEVDRAEAEVRKLKKQRENVGKNW